MIAETHPIMLILLGIISGGCGAYLLKVLLPDLNSKTKKWDCLLSKYSELNDKCENRLKVMEEKMEKLEKSLEECKKKEKNNKL